MTDMRGTLLKLPFTVLGLKKSEEGQDLVEYALLCTLISLSLIASVSGISSAVNNIFANMSNSLAQSQPQPAAGGGKQDSGGRGRGGRNGGDRGGRGYGGGYGGRDGGGYGR
jgi:Flp pilus assembly pilin Flp